MAEKEENRTQKIIKFLQELHGTPCEVGGALGDGLKTDCYAMLIPYLELFGRLLEPYTASEIEDYLLSSEESIEEGSRRLKKAGCTSIPINFQFFGDILRAKMKDEHKDPDYPNYSFFAIDSGNAHCFLADVGHLKKVTPFKQRYLDIIEVYRP